jgi:hypothetical protein
MTLWSEPNKTEVCGYNIGDHELPIAPCITTASYQKGSYSACTYGVPTMPSVVESLKYFVRENDIGFSQMMNVSEVWQTTKK